jgi:hypothetical protein
MHDTTHPVSSAGSTVIVALFQQMHDILWTRHDFLDERLDMDFSLGRLSAIATMFCLCHVCLVAECLDLDLVRPNNSTTTTTPTTYLCRANARPFRIGKWALLKVEQVA